MNCKLVIRNMFMVSFPVILCLLGSCSEFLFQDSGDIVVRRYETAYFDSITFQNIFRVELIPDTIAYVEAECGKNQIKSLKIDVANNTLTANHSFENNLSGDYQKIKLIIHFQKLSKILIENCIEMSCKDTIKGARMVINDRSEISELNLMFNVSYLLVYNTRNSYSTYQFSGFTKSGNFSMNGTSSLFSSNLTNINCVIWQNGIGECYVNVQNKLRVDMAGNGKYFTKATLQPS